MQRIVPSSPRQPLFDVARTRTIEQRALAAVPPHTLMRRAGLATARLALALAPHARRIWVAAGPGNNGGDGFEAAMHLLQWGKSVHLTLCGDAAALPADARDALTRALAAGVQLQPATPPEVDAGDIAIDALLGIGASRAPEGGLASTIALLNHLPCPVLAIDLPSGLRADTGQPLGPHCVQAGHTLSLLTLKPGLFTGAGRDHAGCIWFDSLGVDTGDALPTAWLAATSTLPVRRHVQHKGSFGDVIVVGGALGMTGAALLAARAASAAGAGRVHAVVLADEPPSHDELRPELMFRSTAWLAESASLQDATVVCGCGGGDAVRAALPRLLSRAGRLVLDADALNVIAVDPSLQALLHTRADRGLASVLTPHPLEAARLLQSSTVDVQADRLAAAQTLADGLRCVIVLKGSGSVVAAPGQLPSINPTGNARLASAGTGDVLAGWLGGTWAQHQDGDEAGGAFDAAVTAVFQHGAAAGDSAAGPLRASDLVEAMRSARG
jgi:ADP-dependent NAD(P)H-hydrate dehydratase / NAD(P)H-hydrate epimerase